MTRITRGQPCSNPYMNLIEGSSSILLIIEFDNTRHLQLLALHVALTFPYYELMLTIEDMLFVRLYSSLSLVVSSTFKTASAERIPASRGIKRLT